MKSPRKFLLMLLMLLLPLQAVAAAFAPVLMARYSTMDAPALAAMPCHEHAGAPQAPAAGDAPAPDNTHDSGPANHLCCHQVLSCAPLHVLAAPAHKFGDVSCWVLPLATLFIPDSPDRPPRG